MKKLIYIFTILLLSSCVEEKVDFTKDERFNAGIDYETKDTIPPTILEYGDYTVVTGISKEYGKTFSLYHKNKELYHYTNEFLLFSFEKLLLDSKNEHPSFIYFESVCGDTYVILSEYDKEKETYKEVDLLTYSDGFCLSTPDTMKMLAPITYQYLDSDNHIDVLVDHLVINGVLTPFRCSDTVFYKEIVNKTTEQEEIISFFDAHIAAKNEGTSIEDSYSQFFSSLRYAPSTTYLDSMLDLNNERTLALVTKHPNIWHKEYPRNYIEGDVIDINVNQSFLFKLIDENFSNDAFFIAYKNDFANTGGIAPNMVSNTLYQYDKLDFTNENVRLFFAIHYITYFTLVK